MSGRRLNPAHLLESFNRLPDIEDGLGEPWEPESAERGVEGSPIQVLRKGVFRALGGQEVTIDDAMLDALLEGFATGAAQQEVPIDVEHQQREAAGWIVALYRDADRLYAVPNWNELGRQLVGDKVYRYISATVHAVGRYLISVSLTNFPAVKGLAPLALASHMFCAQPVGLLEDTPSDGEDDGAAGAPSDGGDDFVPYLLLGGNSMGKKLEGLMEDKLPNGSVGDVEVETGADEALPNGSVGDAEAEATESANGSVGDAEAIEFAEPPEEVDMDREKLVAELRDSIGQELRLEFKATMTQAIQEVQSQLRQDLSDEVLDELRETADLHQFSERVTGTGQHALPIKAKDLEALLRRIPDNVRGEVRELMENIHTTGTVAFGEVGTAAAASRRKELIPLLRGQLIGWRGAGHDLHEFFEINELGAPGDYDLSFLDAA